MEEMIDNDDMIRRLMHEDGLLSPSPGFTDRVMMLVKESTLNIAKDYKPLISRKTWIMIALTIAMLLLVCFFGVASEKPFQSEYLHKVKMATDFISGIHVPMHLDSGALLLSTLIMASVGLLFFLDVLLNIGFREAHK